MRQTWRWFGPQDPIFIDEILQTGAEGIMTALHHIPPGEVWTADEVVQRQEQIAGRRDGSPSGLAWEVVESLPVSETIKTKALGVRAHYAAYRDSLKVIAAAGISVVC